MGRMKVFFCAFCLNENQDGTENDQSFNQGVDVSHLATPHTSFVQSVPQSNQLNCAPSAVVNNTNDDNEDGYQPQYNQPGTSSTPPIGNSILDPHISSEPRRIESPLQQQQQSDNQNNIQALPSSRNSSSRSNLYEPPLNGQVQVPIQQQQPQHQQLHHRQQMNHMLNDDNGTSTKLSYDIISVREPLAKILAERQLLNQAQQQQQRQLLGDHEYIEVYGERGSSCFYEEIAGSTTSSATYDQIGNNSNHNYQALINAYAIVNRVNELPELHDDNAQDNNNNIRNGSENIYDVTDSSNQRFSHSNGAPMPSTSFDETHSKEVNRLNHTSESSDHSNFDDTNNILSDSIPVYSVINKATRRSNAIIKATVANVRPPQPPPKNISLPNQPCTSAISTYQSDGNRSNSRNSPQIPHPPSKDNISEFKNGKEQTRLPQPPPRFSKQSTFDATKRPLPLPDNYEILDNNNSSRENDNALIQQSEDIESLNNGYELLKTNFDEDQVDVGYEKIRESHLYSGGSISSQFNALQLLDNGGYESVQPIYSSPSNALVEPNYEAIGPATASELAAAATARLTAAAAVIDFMKQDQ